MTQEHTSTRERINDALKAAIDAEDKRRVCTLRLVNAAIADRTIAARGSGDGALAEEEVQDLLARMIRQRQEAIRAYEEAGQLDMAQQERDEIDIIGSFMPPRLGEAETRQACETVIKEIAASGLKDMGRTMAALKERFGEHMDFSLANHIVKDILTRTSRDGAQASISTPRVAVTAH